MHFDFSLLFSTKVVGSNRNIVGLSVWFVGGEDVLCCAIEEIPGNCAAYLIQLKKICFTAIFQLKLREGYEFVIFI